MLREKRKWIFRQDKTISMFDYIQNALKEKRTLGKHKMFLEEEAA